MKQITSGSLSYLSKNKRTRGEEFLAQMNRTIPLGELLRMLRKEYRREGVDGRPQMPEELMLQIYFLQQWFQLPYLGVEESLHDSASLRGYTKVRYRG